MSFAPAAYARAPDRRTESPQSAGLAGLAAMVTPLLVLHRILQELGFDGTATVQAGAPLSLLPLGAIALAVGLSVQTGEEQPADMRAAGHAA